MILKNDPLSGPKTLMALLALVLFAPSLLAQTADFAKWEKEIAAFEASDKTNPPPKGAILFIGSSSIRLWKTLARDFPEHQVINRGFGGSQIIDSVHFANRVIFPYAPKRIVLYAGGNDINAGKSPEQVCADFKAFVEQVRARLPNTHISYISVGPSPARWAQVEKVKAANQQIQQFTSQKPGLSFINIFPHMLGEDGQPRPELYVQDRLHLNAKGYAIWTSLLRPYLAKDPSP